MLTLAQRTDISPKQVLEVAQNLYEYSPSKTYGHDPNRPREWQQAIQISFNLTERSNFSLEQAIKAAQYFYEYSPHFQYFYEYSSHFNEYRPNRKEWHLLTQMLSNFLHKPNLSMERAIQVTQYLSWISLGQLEKWEMAVQPLLNLAQHKDVDMKQILQFIQYIDKYCPPQSSELESVTHLLLTLVQHPDPPFTPIFQAVKTFGRKKLLLVIQLLLHLGRNKNLTTQQRLIAVTELLAIPETQYSERAEAVQRAITFLNEHGEDINRYLDKHWQPISKEIKASVLDIPFIAELARQKFLPTRARDEMYLLLRELVPQFNMISSES